MNNVNLLTARIVKVAIMLALNESYRPRRLGIIQGLLSPSLNPVRSLMSPYSPKSDSTSINWSIPVGRDIPCPTVTHNFKPAYALNADSERLRDSAEAGLTNGVDQAVVYNYFKQKIYSCTPAKLLYEEKTLSYYEQVLAGNLSMPQGETAQKTRSALVLLGTEFMQSFDATFMVPTNSWALTGLMSNIATNAAYPNANTPTPGAPIVELDAFDGVGAPKDEVVQFFEETKTANNFSGRPIVYGGMTMSRYLRKKNYMAVNDGGFDFKAMFNQIDIEFYYDETIENIGGPGYFITHDSGAAFAETFAYHDFPQFVDKSESDDTVDEKIGVSLVRFNDDDAAYKNGAQSFVRKLDLRIKKKRDANDFTKVSFTPSLAAGRWFRPAGYFTSENDNPLKTMTGVFAGRLI